MGKNYYLVEKCQTCGHKEVTHIGKSSHGWIFALHAIPSAGLTSTKAWLEFLEKKLANGAYITDDGLSAMYSPLELVHSIFFRIKPELIMSKKQQEENDCYLDNGLNRSNKSSYADPYCDLFDYDFS